MPASNRARWSHTGPNEVSATRWITGRSGPADARAATRRTAVTNVTPITITAAALYSSKGLKVSNDTVRAT